MYLRIYMSIFTYLSAPFCVVPIGTPAPVGGTIVRRDPQSDPRGAAPLLRWCGAAVGPCAGGDGGDDDGNRGEQVGL